MKKGLYLGLGVVSPSWNKSIPGGLHVCALINHSLELLLYGELCCSGYCKEVWRKGGAPCLEII